MSPQSGKKDLDARRDLDGKRGLDDKKGPNGKKDLEREVERLTVPERSLFEDPADATPAALLGTHRANPLSVLTEAVKMASGLVVLLAFARMGAVLSGDFAAIMQVALGAVGIFVACAALSYAIWRTRTWELMPDELVIRWGLVNRRQLAVPYEHIHTVTMSSELLERALGLMTLNLDTGAAASEGDASKLHGLRAGEAEALRAELFRRKRAVAPAPDQKNPNSSDASGNVAGTEPTEERPLSVYTLSRHDLLLAAASQMSAGSQAVALVVLLANGLNNLIEWGVLDLAGTGDELMARLAPTLVPVVVAFLLAALLLGAAVSFVLNLVRYAGYRVERYADRVAVEHGLLSRSSSTLAAGRVQYVSVRQGLVRQLMGYVEVRAVVVAAAGEKDGEPSGEVMLHPFLRASEADAFLAEVLPAYAGVLGRAELGRLEVLPAYAGVLGRAELGRLDRVALRRAVVRAVVWWPFAAGLAGLGVWLLGVSGLAEQAAWLVAPLAVAVAILSVVLLAGLVVDAVRGWSASRYGHTARELVLVSGGLTRRTVIVPRSHLQRLRVSVSPFQRRAGLASVSARTAASTTDGLDLRDLPESAALALLDWLS